MPRTTDEAQAAPTPTVTKTSRKRPARRKSTRAASKRARAPKSASPRARSRKRYSSQEKANILAAAEKLGLSGREVAKKFGISMLTFYRWRGPVRGRKRRVLERGASIEIDPGAVRKVIRKQLRNLLPKILREEIDALLR